MIINHQSSSGFGSLCSCWWMKFALQGPFEGDGLPTERSRFVVRILAMGWGRGGAMVDRISWSCRPTWWWGVRSNTYEILCNIWSNHCTLRKYLIWCFPPKMKPPLRKPKSGKDNLFIWGFPQGRLRLMGRDSQSPPWLAAAPGWQRWVSHGPMVTSVTVSRAW